MPNCATMHNKHLKTNCGGHEDGKMRQKKSNKSTNEVDCGGRNNHLNKRDENEKNYSRHKRKSKDIKNPDYSTCNKKNIKHEQNVFNYFCCFREQKPLPIAKDETSGQGDNEHDGQKRDVEEVDTSKKDNEGVHPAKEPAKDERKTGRNKEFGVKLELIWSCKCPKCGRKHSCHCVAPKKPVVVQPIIPEPIKQVAEITQTEEPEPEPVPVPEPVCPCPPGGDSTTVKNIEKEIDYMVGKIKSMELIVDCYDEAITELKKPVPIVKAVSSADRYVITRSTSNPSVICIRPPTNKVFKTCDNDENRDCIRICPQKDSFYVHNSRFTNEDDTLDLVELFCNNIYNILFKENLKRNEVLKNCGKKVCSNEDDKTHKTSSECKNEDKDGTSLKSATSHDQKETSNVTKNCLCD